MAGFEHYFQNEKLEAARHPKVRYWEQKRRDGARLQCELIRKRQGLSFDPAELYVHFLDSEGRDLQSPDCIDWDPRLNDALLDMKVPALSLENEALRFTLVLLDRLQEPEGHFGDGFYNAVLIEYIDSSPFASAPSVAEKRRHISTYAPHKEGRAYGDCWDAIDAVMVGCAREINALHSTLTDAEAVLVGALADYLDERFNITNRRLLGLG